MLKHSLRFLLFAASIAVGSLAAFAQMSDQAVIEYAKTQHALGKDKSTIAQELMAKGVTQEQAERIRNSVMDGGAAGATGSGIAVVDQGHGAFNSAESGPVNVSAVLNPEAVVAATISDVKNSKVFGHNVFTNKLLSFEPNQNMATPADYRLGPGDMVNINIFGESEDNISATISPEGSIILSQIGPIYLNGLTVDEANNRLRRIFSQKYAGFDNHQSDVNLTLGGVRSIMVNVMGEVDVPGTYRLSPFSTVFSALYNAGGVSDVGTIRDVKVMRNGKEVVSIDLYDYIFNGKTSDNIRLQEGDVIMVPVADRVIRADGEVKRPLSFEILPNESIADLLRYAGGFTSGAATGNLVVSRSNGVDKEMYNVVDADFDSFTLRDGDVVTVGTGSNRMQNSVSIAGAVLRPGTFALDSQINTISDLIKGANGLLEDAFTTRAILYRLNDKREQEIVAVDLEGIFNGTTPDITLQRDDNLMIYSINSLFDNGTVTIQGQVNDPGTYAFADDTSIDDLILMAGGLTKGASMARVDVARRVIDPYSLKPTNEIAKIYQFSLNEGYVLNPDSSFHLQPYDVVTIRRSPGYEPQQFVTVNGEVVFGGPYALQKRSERLSEVIRRAGGLTETAYAKGASLRRRVTEEERLAQEEMRRLAMSKQNTSDSISMSMMNFSSVTTVGIDLEKALANPGSTYDIVLREGDVITVPEMISTVSISGDVLFPNTVTYIPGKKFKYYVEQAGGYGERAKKNKAYIVYLNGEVAKAKNSTPIEPGCKIIVPSKGETKGTDWAQIMSISSVIASLATMTATVVSIIR